MIVSPSAGVFAKVAAVSNKSSIDVGHVIGHVGDAEVRSPFAGILQSFIAVDGERVTAHQPIAWLRSH
jgi:[acyl-carrier-protein] S-malonyltransferase